MLSHPKLLVDQVLTDLQTLKPPLTSDPLWAFDEFAHAAFNDQRLRRRLQLLAANFVQQPLASIPQACGTWAKSKGAYRFCANQKVSFEAILDPHYERTLERLGCYEGSLILCPQDTTTLNYMAHPATQGLGHVGTKPGKSLGMLLHSTLALSPEGQFFGLLHAHCWARPSSQKRRRTRSRRDLTISQKETFRWLESFRRVEQLAQLYPQHQWISVEDREGDIYEVLREATTPGHRAGLLVRARHDRSLVGRSKSLFHYLRQGPARGTLVVQVPRNSKQPARTARLTLRFAQVTFAAPRYHTGQAPIPLWALWAQEMNPPQGAEAIRWCLLTTVPVTTLAQASQRIAWYVKRWTIEDFHRVLKSGCQVEARQLTTRQRLQRALAIDMVVAWRMMDLNKAARTQPESPADQWLSTEEWQALYAYRHQTVHVPERPPTIGEAVVWIAQLGGFLARKSDGNPGPMTLWRGLQRLNDIVAAWRAFGPGRRKQRAGKPPRRPGGTKRCG
jgi:hypothetical protein